VRKGSLLVKEYESIIDRNKGFKDPMNAVNLLSKKTYNNHYAKCISDKLFNCELYDRIVKAFKVLIEYNTGPANGERF
jgi:hypothetical protein